MEHFDNIDDYIEDLRGKLAINNECSNTHYNIGVAYLSRRDFQDAESHFLEAAANSPRMAEAFVQLGGIAMQRGDMEGCMNYNVQAAKARPFFAVPWGNIGFVQLQMGETDQAHKSLKKALKLDSEFIQAQATMSSLMITIGDYEEADKMLKGILEKVPEFGPAWNNKAIIDAHHENWEDAKACIAKATEYGFAVEEELRKEIESH